MFDALANLAQRRRKLVVLIAVVLFAFAGALGGGVADKLDPYGAEDPDTEAVIADQRLQDQGYRAAGIRIVAPPTFALITADASGRLLPSRYAHDARAAGLDIITWTLERSGILADGNNGFYYQTFDGAIQREGDVMRVLDVLARDIGVLGVFTDWPATVTFYANCMGRR